MPQIHRSRRGHLSTRTLNAVYSDIGHHREGIRPETMLIVAECKKRYANEVKKLELLTTAQLRDLAERENAPIKPVFGKGQRKRFIDAIARKRAGV